MMEKSKTLYQLEAHIGNTHTAAIGLARLSADLHNAAADCIAESEERIQALEESLDALEARVDLFIASANARARLSAQEAEW